MKNKFLLLAVLTVGLFQITFGQERTSPTRVTSDVVPINVTSDTPPQLEKGGYLVGPGDVIAVRILGEPQFDFTATIDEDGKFQVPFFEKSVMAKCKTEKELRANVIQLVSRYLKSPLVSASIVERKSRPPVSVFGEIRSPQNIDLRRKATLLEVLSFAGGVTEEAGGMIQVFRTKPPMCSETDESGEFPATSDYNSDVPSRMYSLTSVKQGLEGANPVVLPGDIIVVQKAAPIYITGEVIQRIGIRLPEGGLSLSQAIAMVGGVNREAKTKDISIYRLKANSKEREIISANYDAIKKGKQKDIMLEPYDIVEVDKSKKTVAQIVLETVTGVGRQALSGFGGSIAPKILY